MENLAFCADEEFIMRRKVTQCVAALVLACGLVSTMAASAAADEVSGRAIYLKTLKGTGLIDVRALSRSGTGWIVDANARFTIEVVSRPKGSRGFVLLPKRWVVERSLAWLDRYRRNSKDYERLTESSAVMIQISMSQLLLHRLGPS